MLIKQMGGVFSILLFEFQKLVFALEVLVLSPFDQELKEKKHELAGIVLFHTESVVAVSVSFFQIPVESHSQGRKIHHALVAFTRVDGVFLLKLLQKNGGSFIQFFLRYRIEILDGRVTEGRQVKYGLHGRVQVAKVA